MPEFDRLLLFHALRPDRLTASMAKFVANTLGGCGWVGSGVAGWGVVAALIDSSGGGAGLDRPGVLTCRVQTSGLWAGQGCLLGF